MIYSTWNSSFFRKWSLYRFRSSHQRCPIIKGVLRNFSKFIGKHLWQVSFLKKLQAWAYLTLLTKRLWHTCFPVIFSKFLRTIFLQNTSGRLLIWGVLSLWSVYTCTRGHSKSCQTHEMELFMKIIFARSSFLDVWIGSQCTSLYTGKIYENAHVDL